MRITTCLTLAVGAMASPALADPVILTDLQLDAVTAGGANFVLTPGLQPDGRFLLNESRAQVGTVVFPELKDAVGFNFVLNPGHPSGLFVEHNGQVQRSTIISEF